MSRRALSAAYWKGGEELQGDFGRGSVADCTSEDVAIPKKTGPNEVAVLLPRREFIFLGRNNSMCVLLSHCCPWD